MWPSLSGCGRLDMSTENVGIDDCGGPPADDAFAPAEPYERRPLLAGGGPVESGGLSPPASVDRRFLFNAPRSNENVNISIARQRRIEATGIRGIVIITRTHTRNCSDVNFLPELFLKPSGELTVSFFRVGLIIGQQFFTL